VGLGSSENTHKLLKIRGRLIGVFSLSGVAEPVMPISFGNSLPQGLSLPRPRGGSGVRLRELDVRHAV
jgi:hypothetical protein